MKKFAASILSFVIILIMSVNVIAASADTKTDSITITYSNEASYEINIPEGASISSDTGKGTIVVNIENANLQDGTEVSIKISSNNCYQGNGYLVNTNDETDKLGYSISTIDGGPDLENGQEIISSNSDGSVTLYVVLSNTSKVGTFTDTITFTSEIVES